MIWYLLYAWQPALAVLGYYGLLGSGAKKAADEFLPIFGTIMLALIAIVILAMIVGAFLPQSPPAY